MPSPLAGILSIFLRCFNCLCLITDMLQTKIPRIVASLARALQERDILFLQCSLAYGLAEQKSHYIAHIPLCIQRANKVLTCFNAEATHKFSKRRMHSAYKNSHRTGLSYDLHRMLVVDCDVSTFLIMYLLPRILDISSSAALVAALPNHVVTAASAITASRGDSPCPRHVQAWARASVV